MAFCLQLQSENVINVPELLEYGGTIASRDEFALKWLYFKLCLLTLVGFAYALCCAFYSMEYGFVWWFTYYGYINLLLFLVYCSLSAAITVHIYRHIKNSELPQCLKSQESIPVHEQLSGHEDLEDVGNFSDKHRHHRSLDPLDLFYETTSLQQLNVEYLAKGVAIFHYMSLVGLCCNALLFWIHEFETAEFERQSIKMRFIVIITNVVTPCFALLDFGCSGLRFQCSWFLYPAMVMIAMTVINALQICNNALDIEGEWHQHLFTELDWVSNPGRSVVVCIWSLAVLIICHGTAALLKSLCLCSWTAKQRRNQIYVQSREAALDTSL